MALVSRSCLRFLFPAESANKNEAGLVVSVSSPLFSLRPWRCLHSDPLIHIPADLPDRFSLLLFLLEILWGRATIITAFSHVHVEYKASLNLRVPGATAWLRPASGIRSKRAIRFGSYHEMKRTIMVQYYYSRRVLRSFLIHHFLNVFIRTLRSYQW